MSSCAAPSLADRLVTACSTGDLPSAKAAVVDGASVNEKGKAPGWGGSLVTPLAAAVFKKHHDVAVWLLSCGADPNGDDVMRGGSYGSTDVILQLLIDAGGDVNRGTGSYGQPPLFSAVEGDNSKGKLRVLLAQPALDFTIEYDGKTPEQYALEKGRPKVARRIAKEVRTTGRAFFLALPGPVASGRRVDVVLTVCGRCCG